MAEKNLNSWLKKVFLNYWYAILLLVVYFLRLPSLFEPFTYGDEGIYVTLGQAVRRGLVLYRDIHDNKPPFLYLLAGLVGSFEYFRLILFYWSILTILVFYQLAKLIFQQNKMAIIATTGVFGLLSSLHTFEGNVANAENFMLLPTIMGVILILESLNISGLGRIHPSGVSKRLSVPTLRRDISGFLLFFLAGILFSLATLFKIPAAFDFAAVLVFLFLIFFEKKKKNYSLLTLGFLLPILTSILYYASQNALNQYFTAAFLQNLPYLSSWASGQTQAGGLPLPLLGRGIVLLLSLLTLFILRPKISLATKLILPWFGFSWFAALLSSRPYPHYLIQLLPAFSLSFGLFFVEPKKQLKERLIPSVLLIVLVTTFAVFRFWRYSNLPYYLNFYQHALRFKSQQEYFSDFDPQAETIYSVADYIKSHTSPDEKIFIWGNDPFIYALSQRPPLGRYTVAYHIVDFDGYQETIKILTKNLPRYLIVTGTENRPFPELTAFIQNNYLLETQIDSVQIFHRQP